MNTRFEQTRDPLGLRKLTAHEPPNDGWPALRAELEAQQAAGSRRRVLGWLALAASVVMALVIGLQQGIVSSPEPATVEIADQPANQQEDTLQSLIALSQTLEQQVRGMNSSTVSMPAESAVYVAELQDLVAQVDEQLSYSPDAINLWGQRVNLLLDLAQIYQHQWELDYGKMASL